MVGKLVSRSRNVLKGNRVPDRAISVHAEAECELRAWAINSAVPNLHKNQPVIRSIYSYFEGEKPLHNKFRPFPQMYHLHCEKN